MQFNYEVFSSAYLVSRLKKSFLQNTNYKIPDTNSGQSIIELVAVIAIGTILILALVTLSTRSDSSADFSKASNQASQLASEGMEVLKNIKAGSGSVVISSAVCGATASTYSWGAFYSIDVSDTCGGNANGESGYLSSGCSGSCFNLNGNSTTEAITVDGRVFQRQFFVADTATAFGGKSQCNSSASDFNLIKQYTVVVSWTDTLGAHNTTNTTCLKVN